jgi:hypothetical protein
MFGNRLKFSLTVHANWLHIDSTSGVISGMPGTNDLGKSTFEVMVCDGVGGITARPFVVDVLHSDRPPRLEGLPNIVIREDSSAWINLRSYVSDIDDSVQTLRWSITLDGTENLNASSTMSPKQGKEKTKPGFTNVSVVLTSGKVKNALHDDNRVATSPGSTPTLIINFDTLSTTLQFTATPNFVCSRLPVYVTVTDPSGARAKDTIYVTISPVNNRPVLAALDTVKFKENDSLFVPFSSWFTLVHDPDNPTESLKWKVASGNHVRVTSAASGSVFKSERYWSGSDTLLVTVSDSAGLSDSTRLIVSVIPVDNPPQITCAADTFGCVGARYSFHVTAKDPDDSLLVYSLRGPTWLHIDAAGTVQGVPTSAGEFPVVVLVSDPHGAADSLRYVLSVTVLKSVVDLQLGIPTEYRLEQNYPNPFNPSTRIRFGLPERSFVRMSVYNIAGQQVDCIPLNEQEAGYHEVIWQPSNIASGAYLMVLDGKGLVSRDKEFRIMKKAVLLR